MKIKIYQIDMERDEHRIAMMGYNMAMIYTKDAYQLPDEPYFGYMRGAYSMEEIREELTKITKKISGIDNSKFIVSLLPNEIIG